MNKYIMKNKSIKPFENDLDFCAHCSGSKCCDKIERDSLIDPPYLTKYDLENIKKEEITLSFKSKGCRFLSENGKCVIHKIRPLDCRLFPFDIDLQKEKYVWILYDYYCQDYLKNEIIELLLKKAEKEILPLFEKEELKAYAMAQMGLFEKGKWRMVREVNLIG